MRYIFSLEPWVQICPFSFCAYMTVNTFAKKNVVKRLEKSRKKSQKIKFKWSSLGWLPWSILLVSWYLNEVSAGQYNSDHLELVLEIYILLATTRRILSIYSSSAGFYVNDNNSFTWTLIMILKRGSWICLLISLCWNVSLFCLSFKMWYPWCSLIPGFGVRPSFILLSWHFVDLS